MDAVLRYLEDEWNDKRRGIPFPKEEWKLVNTGNKVPQQGNGDDCGVFVCAFAENISRSKNVFDNDYNIGLYLNLEQDL